MKKKIISFIIILIGLGLAFYPWISNWMFERDTKSQVTVYEDNVKDQSELEREKMLEEAREYNKNLSQSQVVLTDPFVEEQVRGNGNLKYDSILDIDGYGMMAYIEIPCINVNLPVYHGTDSDTLESGIGHLEGSSFPVGGKSTHAVLTGHTGLNKARLFTDLTEMKEKDLFFIHIGGEIFAYEVFEIVVVKPEEVEKLLIRDGEDLVTLITCTPYGVNTHRLFVTGRRTEYTPEVYKAASEDRAPSVWMKTYRKGLLIGLGISSAFVVFIGFVRLLRRKRKKK